MNSMKISFRNKQTAPHAEGQRFAVIYFALAFFSFLMQEKICSSSTLDRVFGEQAHHGTRIKLMSMAAAPALMGLTRFKGQFKP